MRVAVVEIAKPDFVSHRRKALPYQTSILAVFGITSTTTTTAYQTMEAIEITYGDILKVYIIRIRIHNALTTHGGGCKIFTTMFWLLFYSE